MVQLCPYVVRHGTASDLSTGKAFVSVQGSRAQIRSDQSVTKSLSIQERCNVELWGRCHICYRHRFDVRP